MKRRKFSIVTPVKDEHRRLERSLKSFYKVNPDEVIICTDDPPPRKILETVKRVAADYDMSDRTIVHPVVRNPEYSYHQAWVRRSGFLKASNDIVLTSDVDLDINRSVFKAINLVGKNNIGLVSLSKFRHPYDLQSFIRTMGYFLLRINYFFLFRPFKMGAKSGKGLRMTLFTGLYAFYRPYWLDSEDEGVKKIVPSVWKQENPQNFDQNAYNAGEDNYLRDCMEKKHRVLYLTRIGAVVFDRDKHADPGVQFQRGRYSVKRGRSLIGAILHTIFHVEPDFFRGFIFERNYKSKVE